MSCHADRHLPPASPRARLRRSAQAFAAALLAGLAIVAASKAWASDEARTATEERMDVAARQATPGG